MMKKILEQVKSKLGKPYFDLEYLLGTLKETLIENGEEKQHSENGSEETLQSLLLTINALSGAMRNTG